MKSKQIQLNKGFTIIEMMVSVFMLTLVIAGSMLLVYRSVGSANANVTESIARNLAAEGIEIVDNTRTTNFLKNSVWTSNLDECFDVKGCYVDVNTIIKDGVRPVYQACGGSCPRLRFDKSIGYQYTSGSETNFKRTISLEFLSNNSNTPNPDAMLVTSQVLSLVGGQANVTELKKVLTNWKKN